MNKIFNEQDIRVILNHFEKIGGLSCSNVPIKISTRMQRTYGAFVFIRENGNIKPHAFKFSLKLLQGDFKEKTVIDTIGHEYAHFLVNVRDNVNHNHDKVFKEACRNLGVPEDTHFKESSSLKPKTGYILTCSKCNKEVGRRRRRDSALNIKRNYKSGCCREDIIVRKTIF